MKNRLLIACILFLSSCGLFNNISDSPRNVNTDRSYILINNTPFDDLRIYISRKDATDCNEFRLVTRMRINTKYPFHVSPGETVYVRYCSTDDIFCSGCKSLKLIGNSETYGNDITLQ